MVQVCWIFFLNYYQTCRGRRRKGLIRTADYKVKRVLKMEHYSNGDLLN